jgi:hypothetical protein
MSSLQISSVNDIANGALNRVWVAPGGRIATALVGSVDSILSEAGAYGISYIAPSGFALMAWPSGGIPFVAPKISGLSLARVPASTGADVTVFGDGLAAFLAARPAGVRLVSDVTGQSTELVVKSKTLRSVTISIAPGTVAGSYHLVVWTPLGLSIATANAAALTVLSPGLR